MVIDATPLHRLAAIKTLESVCVAGVNREKTRLYTSDGGSTDRACRQQQKQARTASCSQTGRCKAFGKVIVLAHVVGGAAIDTNEACLMVPQEDE